MLTVGAYIDKIDSVYDNLFRDREGKLTLSPGVLLEHWVELEKAVGKREVRRGTTLVIVFRITNPLAFRNGCRTASKLLGSSGW
jgi:hypothetical protein